MPGNKPIFIATHPRACSTAFERVFMTRRDILKCAHEPFGDAFYYGPERLSDRYADDAAARESSGFSQTTYQDVLNRLERDGREGKRILIKDMAYYLMPPNGKPPSLAPSVSEKSKANRLTNGSGTNGSAKGPRPGHADGVGTTNGTTGANSTNGAHGQNPCVLPLHALKEYHFTFLIRHPRRAIPSFYRCTVPPLDAVTGFHNFMASEAGYSELRRLFNYLREQKVIGTDQLRILVLDADDLLDHPSEVVQAFCNETGIDFSPDMLQWDNAEDQEYVAKAFEKWIGFHNDAINSTSLSPRKTAHKTVTDEMDNNEWRDKYGDEGQKVIRACVDENIPHYEYLKSFALSF